MTRTIPLTLILLFACSDRPRPDPYGPGTPAALSVQVLEPRSGTTVSAGTTTNVRVLASERGLRLTGVGFVARVFNGPRLDSVLLAFPERADTFHVFTLQIPATLATNTQVDITALAFSGRTGLRSATQSVVIIGRLGTLSSIAR